MNWIHHKKILQRGYGEFGLVLGLFNNAMIFWLLARDLFELRRMFILILPVFGTLVLGCLYMLGIFYERKLIRGEYHWETARNEPFMKVMKDIEEIKEALGNRSGEPGCGGCRNTGDLSCSGNEGEGMEGICGVPGAGNIIEIIDPPVLKKDPGSLLPSPEGNEKE